MQNKKRIVVLSGAGMSAESGISTFRDSNGLWEGYDVMEVASPEGWRKNKELVLDFYNQRRKNVIASEPNKAHRIIAQLETDFNVKVITQNVDDLHERANSSNIIHLHGEIRKSRSTLDEKLIYNINGWELNLGDKCEKGSQLRPHIVWFGEEVPMMINAINEIQTADVVIIIGTSMVVYPAAGLVHYAPPHVPVYVIDPNKPSVSGRSNVHFITEKATAGMEILVEKLMTLQ